MSKLFSRKSSVGIHLLYDQKLYLVYPGAAFLAEESSTMPSQTTITGNVMLCIADKARTYKSISLTHEIRWDARVGGQRTKGVLSSRRYTVLDQQQTFTPGQHLIPFAYLEESSAPPDKITKLVQDHAVFSVIRFVVIHLHGVDQTKDESKTMDPWITAPCDCQDRQTAAMIPRCTCQATPNPVGELPPPLNLNIEGFLAEVGPHKLTMSSNSLTVASLVKLSVEFVDPPTPFQITSLSADIIQQVTWISPDQESAPAWSSTPQRVRFLHVVGQHGGPLLSVQHGLSADLSAIARLPHDLQIDSTTLNGTKTPLMIDHELRVALELNLPGNKLKMIEVRRPITIPSCELVIEALLLPNYSTEPTKPLAYNEFQPDRPADPFACACGIYLGEGVSKRLKGRTGFSIDQLLERMRGAATEDDGDQFSISSEELQRRASKD